MMTSTVQPTKSTPFSEDPQRQLLARLTALCIECAKEETRIEEQYHRDSSLHRAAIQSARDANEEKRHKNLTGIEQKRAERMSGIEERHMNDLAALEKSVREARSAAEDEKTTVDEQIRKQTEQARWLAESVLEAVQTQLEVESRQAKQAHDTRIVEIEQLQNARTAVLARLEQPQVPFDPLAGEEINRRLREDADKLYGECTKSADERLKILAALSTPRFVAGGTPYLAALFLCIGAAVLVQFAFSDIGAKVTSAAVAVVVATLASVAGTLHLKRRARAEVIATCVPISQSIELASRANETSYANGEARRHEREREERLKCAREVDLARDKGKPLSLQAHEKRSRTLAEIDERQKQLMAQIVDKRRERVEELESVHRSALEAADHAYEHEKRRIDAEDQSRSGEIQKQHDDDSSALLHRWNEGLETIGRLLADKDRVPPAPLDWSEAAWEQWHSPRDFPLSVPFGNLKVDLRTLTDSMPQRLALPQAFTIPAVLAFPQRGSVLIETDHGMRSQAISIASLVMARLLTHMPAGRVKFTIIDPVGLGQSFAGFMHLADHDESLIGSRIWTETEHIEQRLADLTEHMETVIQKYLRNEYQTIDQYNAQAGELAEPVRVLVIADFPVGFEQDSLRRLASIATSGARCGVYTIIIRDTRQQLPQGSHYEELVSRSIHLRLKEGSISWIDEVFSRFPLTLDGPPDEKMLTSIMDMVGRAAREAKRVEVPFDTIAPRDQQFWTASSRDELKVAIGKSGATRLQPLRLGVGVAQHALVAGKTGSGKSNLMHTIVTNMAMWYSPDEVEFYLVDFKKGVEFKTYVTRQLPHARAIAVESDREFGLSVLQRVDAELTRRGELFRAAGVQEISSYRQQTKQRLPRTLLLIDEFQEFFSEDDKLGQEAAVLLDRLVRQGRAFGVHVVLGSQTIGGSSGLPRSTLGQMAVRIALQCSEADSQLILGDNNSAARLLSRPGEAIYNDAGGLVEANSPFQIAFLPDDKRDHYLQAVDETAQEKKVHLESPPVVFEGNSPADIAKNPQLVELLAKPHMDATPHAVTAWIGEPVSIKDPTSVTFRRQSGSNLLLIGQQDESALAVMASSIVSLATQHAPAAAKFIIMDGSPADSPLAGLLARTVASLPHASQVVSYREVEEVISQLADELTARDADSDKHHDAIFLFVNAIQRYRSLRRQEESFSFSSEEQKPKTDRLFARIITEGPSLGIHVITWADTAVTLDRTFERGVVREFDHRVLFQMSSTDSSNLIDSPAANKLGQFRALAYSEEMGTLEKFRPYALPSDAWLKRVAAALKR